MNVTITARHHTLPGPVARRTLQRLQRLARFEPRLAAADVTYDLEHGVHRVTGRLHVAGGPTLVAHAEHTASARAALDRTVESLARQLKRHHQRRRDHRAPPLGERVPAGGER